MKEVSIKKNAVLNSIKQAANVVFPIILYPYVTRVMGKVAYGRYSFAYSIMEYALILVALGIPAYGIREGAQIKNDRKRIHCFAAEMLSISAFSLALTLIIYFICIKTIGRFGREESLLLIMSVNVVAYGFSRDYLFEVYEDYLFISVRYIVVKLLALVLVFFFVKDPEDLNAFAWIMIGSEAAGFIAGLLFGRKYVPLGIKLDRGTKEHIKPIFYLFCTTVAIRIYIQSDITILGFFVGDAEVGVYSLASKVYSVIKSMLNASIFVCIPRIAAYLGDNNRKEYNRLLNSMLRMLPAIILPCVTGAFFLSKNILLFVGGQEFVEGTAVLKLLCAALFFAVFGCFFAQGVLVPNKQEKRFFLFTAISAVVNIVLNILIIPILGITAAALTTVLAEIIICSLCAVAASKLFDPENQKEIIVVIIGCAVIAAVCLLFLYLIESPLIQTIVCVSVSVVLYIVILSLGKHPAAEAMRDALRIKKKP